MLTIDIDRALIVSTIDLAVSGDVIVVVAITPAMNPLTDGSSSCTSCVSIELADIGADLQRDA